MRAGKETQLYNQGYMDGYNEGENAHIDPDYWTRLEHTYAGMAMQRLMSYVEQITPKKGRSFCDEIVDISFKVAHALVEKYKENETNNG